MRVWSAYLRWTLGGTAVLTLAVLGYLFVLGDPAGAWGMFFVALYWLMLCSVIGLMLIAASAVRIAVRQVASRR